MLLRQDISWFTQPSWSIGTLQKWECTLKRRVIKHWGQEQEERTDMTDGVFWYQIQFHQLWRIAAQKLGRIIH